MNFTDMQRHPFLLFWHSEPNPHEIGAGIIDRLHIGSIFLLRERAERWRSVSGNDQAREALLEARNQSLDNARASSVEKVPVAPLRCPFADRQEQVRSADAACVRITRALAPPNKRHPVLCRQARLVESTSNLRISLRLHQAVNRGETDVFATLFG